MRQNSYGGKTIHVYWHYILGQTKLYDDTMAMNYTIT